MQKKKDAQASFFFFIPLPFVRFLAIIPLPFVRFRAIIPLPFIIFHVYVFDIQFCNGVKFFFIKEGIYAQKVVPLQSIKSWQYVFEAEHRPKSSGMEK